MLAFEAEWADGAHPSLGFRSELLEPQTIRHDAHP
jgi:hypothetical protein